MSGWVELNGEKVVAPREVKKSVASVEKAVVHSASNSLEAGIRGFPGSAYTGPEPAGK